MTQDVEEANAPAPRLCHVTRWADFDGYGFNLHSDKQRAGQFIGKVDENSPAQAAGLITGDRIVEVNGVNVANENHKQVVERIKTVRDETRLLVVDSQTDAWFREQRIVIRGALKNVIYLQNPATRTPIHQESETVIQDLVDEKAPPISAAAIADRRASVRSNDPPSKSGSLHIPTPPLNRKGPSVTSIEHVEERRKSVAIDNHPILHSNVEIPEERDDGKSVTSEEISVDPVQDNTEMIEKYQETTSSVEVEGIDKDELASKLLGYRPPDDHHEAAPPLPVSEISHLAENVQKQSILIHTEDQHSHELPSHSQVHFSASTAESLDQLEVEKRQSFHEPELLPPAPKSPHLDSEIPHRTASVKGSMNGGHSPILERPDSGTVREELFESSKVERNDHSPITERSSQIETSRKSSVNGDSSSDSSRSLETGSYNVAKQHSHDDLGFDETKTPSPSPAVVPDSYRPTISPSPSNNFTSSILEKEDGIPDQKAIATKSAAAVSKPAPNYSGLTLNVTAQEMRETLSRRRKIDPRTQSIDMKKKHELIDNM